MPIYEYACRSCEKKFEKLVRSMSSQEKIPCPACGSVKTARAMSVFAVGAGGASEQAPAPRDCGHCQEPGGCGMN